MTTATRKQGGEMKNHTHTTRENPMETATVGMEQKRAEILEKVDNELAKLRDKAEGYLTHLPAALEVVSQFPEIVEESSYKDDPLDEVSIGYMPNQTNGILVSWHECKDLRAIRPMLREFARRGYRVKRQEDYAEIGRRSWILAHDDDPDTEAIRVNAFLPYKDTEGAACRVVETGEMKPVKKIVCPDDADALATH